MFATCLIAILIFSMVYFSYKRGLKAERVMLAKLSKREEYFDRKAWLYQQQLDQLNSPRKVRVNTSSTPSNVIPFRPRVRNENNAVL